MWLIPYFQMINFEKLILPHLQADMNVKIVLYAWGQGFRKQRFCLRSTRVAISVFLLVVLCFISLEELHTNLSTLKLRPSVLLEFCCVIKWTKSHSHRCSNTNLQPLFTRLNIILNIAHQTKNYLVTSKPWKKVFINNNNITTNY